MAGLYVHIPFCKQACRYCDFFFSVSLHYVDAFVDSLLKEMELRAGELPGTPLETLYLGGGTPSVLSEKHLDQILEAVHTHYNFQKNDEWTIECNPDDLSPAYLTHLRKLGFTRISIGIQSFHQRDLELMRRSHTAAQAERSVQDAAAAGFENITVDLIYGIPDQSLKEWEENISQALSLPISHISAYHLTFESGTVFDHWRKKGRLLPVHEEASVSQYHLLRKRLAEKGFDHYEISNFAREGHMSRHNMIYWSGKSYLGLGPSAHSFDSIRRSWNVSSLKEYMEGIASGNLARETEDLSPAERYHDYLITSLRTRWGADPQYIQRQFGAELSDHFRGKSKTFLEQGSMQITENRVVIHPDHWLIADHILRELLL
ncbi:MAG: radical SAM family heme chaperone HemW [Bacteroidota bacterium]